MAMCNFSGTCRELSASHAQSLDVRHLNKELLKTGDMGDPTVDCEHV